jgi:hypothetical protein
MGTHDKWQDGAMLQVVTLIDPYEASVIWLETISLRLRLFLVG